MKVFNYIIATTTVLLLVSCSDNGGPAENFLVGKCGWDISELSSEKVNSCDPTKLVNSLDAENFMVGLRIFRDKNFSMHIRVHNSKPRNMNFDGSYPIEYILIDSKKMQAVENINGCLFTYEYEKNGPYVIKTAIKIAGERCHRAQIRAFEIDQSDPPSKLKLIDNIN